MAHCDHEARHGVFDRIKWCVSHSRPTRAVSFIRLTTVWYDKIQQQVEVAPRLHIFLVCAEHGAPWTVISPKATIFSSPSKTFKTASSSKQIYTDASFVVFGVHPALLLTVATTPPPIRFDDFQVHDPSRSSQDTLEEESTEGMEMVLLPHDLPILPHATTVLLSSQHRPLDTTADMLHIHLLHSFHSNPAIPSLPDDTTTHLDFTQNFFELAVLASARNISSPLSPSGLLPLHLVVLESMSNCLDIDWDAVEQAHDA